MNSPYLRKDLIFAALFGLAIWLILTFFPQFFLLGWLLNVQGMRILIFCAIALILIIYLVSLCVQYFQRSKTIIAKLLALLTAMGIVGFAIPQFWLQFLLLSITPPVSFCNISLDKTIDFLNYSKTIYIVNHACLLGEQNTVYVREGESFFPTIKQIGTTSNHHRDSTSIERSELIPKGTLLRFKEFDVSGEVVDVTYNLETGEIAIVKLEDSN